MELREKIADAINRLSKAESHAFLHYCAQNVYNGNQLDHEAIEYADQECLDCDDFDTEDFEDFEFICEGHTIRYVDEDFELRWDTNGNFVAIDHTETFDIFAEEFLDEMYREWSDATI